MTSQKIDLFATSSVTLSPYSSVLVALSGGVDSTVLLHLCLRITALRPDFQVRAVYVHHGLSPFANDWAAHCQHLCETWQIPFLIQYVTLDKSAGNIEAQARHARYNAISEIILPGEVLLTAQHLDDQCETFLLALKRGSGPAGLSAMPAVSMCGANLLCRPLLSVSRTQIERYAADNALEWIHDESNDDPRFDRNFLRLSVLPALTSRWPQFTEMVARSAELCAEQESALDELLAAKLSHCIDESGRLSIPALALESSPIRAMIFRRWFAQHSVNMPSRDQLHHIWRDVALARQDAEPCYQSGDWQVRRYQEKLYFLPTFADLSQQVIAWDMVSPLILPDSVGLLSVGQSGSHIRSPVQDERVTVRFSAEGRVDIVGRAGSRKIKKLWQELAIPPWQRHRIPLIYYDECLIAAVGVFVTKAGAPLEHSSQIFLRVD